MQFRDNSGTVFLVPVTTACGTGTRNMKNEFSDLTAPCPCADRSLQAAHVAENEEGCLAYELSVNADDPDSFIIYER